MKRIVDKDAVTGHRQEDQGGATAAGGDAEQPGTDAKPPRLLLRGALSGSLNGGIPTILVNWLAVGMPDSTAADVVNLGVSGFAGGFAGAVVVVLTHQRKVRERAAAAGGPTARPPLAIRIALACGLLAGLIGAVFTMVVGYGIVGMPDSELVNVLQHSIGGLLTGMFGGFLGLLIYLRYRPGGSLRPQAVG